ncbi:hypothetical protein Btru_073170 [Bulinus truncatus]|nr:hypothetical protein Btru_073170 [Bulinus truncatus]
MGVNWCDCEKTFLDRITDRGKEELEERDPHSSWSSRKSAGIEEHALSQKPRNESRKRDGYVYDFTDRINFFNQRTTPSLVMRNDSALPSTVAKSTAIHNLTHRKVIGNKSLESKSKLQSYFLPRNTRHLESQFRALLAVFDKLLTEKGMAYFLYGGSLLGSYRHHGLIPWDDDVDVMMSFTQRHTLHQLLGSLAPELEFSARKSCSWKLFPASAEPLKGLPWKWPYLDIFFYQENSTHIWDVCASYITQFSFKKSAVFPLRRRPFLGLNLSAPKDPKAVIENNYNIADCESSTLIHRWEIVKNPVRVPCSSLHAIHPFVTRTFMNGGCNETLVHQGKITNVFFDWGVTC